MNKYRTPNHSPLSYLLVAGGGVVILYGGTPYH